MPSDEFDRDGEVFGGAHHEVHAVGEVVVAVVDHVVESAGAEDEPVVGDVVDSVASDGLCRVDGDVAHLEHSQSVARFSTECASCVRPSRFCLRLPVG